MIKGQTKYNIYIYISTNFKTTLLSSEKTADLLSRNLCYVKIVDQWRASPSDRRNKSVFIAFLNWSNDVIDGGRLFQTFAAATGKARSPIVL